MCAACTGENVTWTEVRTSNVPQLPGRDHIGMMVPAPDACPVSVRATRSGRDLIAAWWTARRDSSGILYVARSPDGGSNWTAPVVADANDRSARGCGRPAPAIAADSATGYVHIAYFTESKSGRGIFFAHSMDGGKTFHAAVPIVFGDNPAFVSVASDGDRVAVAYDDPNSAQPAIGVALSTTMGHLFHTGEIVSSETERAKMPTIEVRGDTVRVWWNDYAADPRISATRPAYREGIIR
jgi:hypothetical protein